MSFPYVIDDVAIATMIPGQVVSGKSDYGLIRQGAIVVEGETIKWAGEADLVPAEYSKLERIGFEGRMVTPALIDCHTHIVHGGNRAREFEMRLNGASYEEIAKAGGGIVSTVTMTRAESFDELLQSALKRVDALITEGVATIEVKSGYGLDMDTELKMLRVARELGKRRDIKIKTSFLGAHAVPAGVSADVYIDEICIPTLEAAHGLGLVDAVDAFCENIAFDSVQISRVFDKAVVLGLPLKLHGEQLSHCGGTSLAAKYGALSADHVEYATNEDVVKMAASGTVAVLLPGAFYTLNESQKPPVAAFREHGVPMAIGTDWNPGSSPLGSLLLAMNMACTLFHLTPQEALAGTTRNGAQALGLNGRGMIRQDMRADLAVWNIQDPAELCYHIGYNPLHRRIFGGRL